MSTIKTVKVEVNIDWSDVPDEVKLELLEEYAYDMSEEQFHDFLNKCNGTCEGGNESGAVVDWALDKRLLEDGWRYITVPVDRPDAYKKLMELYDELVGDIKL